MRDRDKINQAIKEMLTSAAANAPQLTTQQYLEREHNRAIEAAKRREREWAEMRERLTWLCPYCGKVHQPTEQAHPLRDEIVLVRPPDVCDCPKSQQARDLAQREAEAAVQRRHVAALETAPLWLSFDTTWPNDPKARAELERTKNRVRSWYIAARSDGGGLLLSGRYGCGKSHLLRCVVHAFGIQGAQVAFYNEPEILDHLEDNQRKGELTAHCKRAKVLVLDDFGRLEFDKYSGWKGSLLQSFYFRILESRAGDPDYKTLFSTNYLAETLGQRIGEVVLDRVYAVIGDKSNWLGMWSTPSYRRRNFQ